MPYKSEKIPIAGTKFDRRIKLSQKDKEHIVRMRNQYGTSYKMLAEMFGVSKRMIMFVCKPEQYEKAKERFKFNKRIGKYRLPKEEATAVMREHRRYKQKLHINGDI